MDLHRGLVWEYEDLGKQYWSVSWTSSQNKNIVFPFEKKYTYNRSFVHWSNIFKRNASKEMKININILVIIISVHIFPLQNNPEFQKITTLCSAKRLLFWNLKVNDDDDFLSICFWTIHLVYNKFNFLL